MRKHGLFALLLCACLLLCGCARREARAFSVVWTDLFDTQISLTAYAAGQDEFDRAADAVYALLARLDAVFDVYEPHEGVEGAWAVNQAGGRAVRAERELIELLEQSLIWHEACGAFNPAMGSVLALWHEARETGALPSDEALREAAGHMDCGLITVDAEAGVIRLGDPEMRLDLGAVAKGWAMARAARLLDGLLPHYLLNGGGNIVCGLAPLDGRSAWSVGVRDPRSENAGDCVRVLRLTSCAAVSSGGYQRWVEIDGVRYHHLIDPGTLRPSNLHLQSTVVCADSALADFLSTATFLLPTREAQALAERFGAELFLED